MILNYNLKNTKLFPSKIGSIKISDTFESIYNTVTEGKNIANESAIPIAAYGFKGFELGLIILTQNSSIANDWKQAKESPKNMWIYHIHLNNENKNLSPYDIVAEFVKEKILIDGEAISIER